MIIFFLKLIINTPLNTINSSMTIFVYVATVESIKLWVQCNLVCLTIRIIRLNNIMWFFLYFLKYVINKSNICQFLPWYQHRLSWTAAIPAFPLPDLFKWIIVTQSGTFLRTYISCRYSLSSYDLIVTHNLRTTP